MLMLIDEHTGKCLEIGVSQSLKRQPAVSLS
jgi:hypothetical protein